MRAKAAALEAARLRDQAEAARQETEVDRLRDEIKKLQDDELAQRKAYEDFLAALDVE